MINVRKFAIFAIIVFLGSLIGGWIVENVPLPEGILGSAIAFLIPILVLYLLLQRFGRRTL